MSCGRGDAGKPNIPPTFSNTSKLTKLTLFFFFFLQQCGSFPTRQLDFVDFHKSSLIYGWLSKKYSPGASGPWAREARAGLQATLQFSAGMEVCMPNTWCTIWWDFSWPLVLWCWIPWPPQSHFCTWMDAKLLLFSVGHKWWMSRLAIWLMSLQKFSHWVSKLIQPYTLMRHTTNINILKVWE